MAITSLTIALLNAQLRSVELQLASLDRDAAIRARFLADTPFESVEALEQQITDSEVELERIKEQRRTVSNEISEVAGVQELRETVLATRARRAEVSDRLLRLEAQISDLSDLKRQLSTQSARLTRAIVADEWLVDFDFIVCPRCGNSVDAGRTTPDRCYSRLQEPRPAPSRAQLLSEQDRVTSQIVETTDVIGTRETAHHNLKGEAARLDEVIASLNTELDQRTAVFVSDRTTQIEYLASEQTRIEDRVIRLREYLHLLQRHYDQMQSREDLEARREQLSGAIASRELSQTRCRR